MTTSEKFLRFAAECETIAHSAGDQGTKAVWRGFAARWLQCAESIDRRSAAAKLRRENEGPRHRKSKWDLSSVERV